MPRVTLTSNLVRHVECPSEVVDGVTIREALEHYFALHPATKHYLFDEQAALRQHVVVFVGGVQARDRQTLSDAVRANDEIYVMQALSGG